MQPSIHSLALAGALATTLLAAPAFALPLISEVFYDGVRHQKLRGDVASHKISTEA